MTSKETERSENVFCKQSAVCSHISAEEESVKHACSRGEDKSVIGESGSTTEWHIVATGM